MPCEKCAHLTETIEIKLPADLTRVLGQAKEALASGVLREIKQFDDGRVLFEDTPFNEVRADGPWPDVFSYYFACIACGSRFEVAAETYHGRGGAWCRSVGPR